MCTYNLSDFWMNADDYAAKRTSKDAEKIQKEVLRMKFQILSFLQHKLPHGFPCFL